METSNHLGCKINAIPLEELFHRLYEKETGLLYYDRKEFVAPHLSKIKETWRKAQGDEDLLRVYSIAKENSQHLASITNWRYSNRGDFVQCLAANNFPEGALSVLRAQYFRFHASKRVFQLWFQKTNSCTNRYFGEGKGKYVGSKNQDLYSHREFYYLTLPKSQDSFSPGAIRVVPYTLEKKEELRQFVLQVEGKIFWETQELGDPDFHLEKLNKEYQAVGLFRRRDVLLAYGDSSPDPIGAVVIYRGPFGINLRYLENACFFLHHPFLSEAQIYEVSQALIAQIPAFYHDFPASFIPILTSSLKGKKALEKGNARYHILYNQFAVVPEGIEPVLSPYEAHFRKMLARVPHFSYLMEGEKEKIV